MQFAVAELDVGNVTSKADLGFSLDISRAETDSTLFQVSLPLTGAYTSPTSHLHLILGDNRLHERGRDSLPQGAE